MELSSICIKKFENENPNLENCKMIEKIDKIRFEKKDETIKY